MNLQEVLAYPELAAAARHNELLVNLALNNARHLAEHVRLIVVAKGIEEGSIPKPNGRKVSVTEVKDAEARYLDASEAYAHSMADVARWEKKAAIAKIERQLHEENLSMVRALMYERSGVKIE